MAHTKDRAATALLPEHISRRKLPLNLDPADLRLFEHELTKIIPPVRLLELRNVRVSPDGVLIKRGHILDESYTFPFLRKDWKKRTVAKSLAQNYLRPTRLIDEEVMWITDLWSLGYFHWFADALCKLEVVTDLLRERILLLPHEFRTRDFVSRSLEAFGVQRIQFIAAEEVVRCRKLILPTPVAPSGHFREEIIQSVRGQLLEHFVPAAERRSDRRIYISRERAPKRKIANEPDVRAVLEKFGFETLHAEDLLFADQVKVMSEARYLVSNHGAGLTNMLFMSPRASVFELRRRTDRVNNCYFTLSSALNLNYFYQGCDSVAAGEDAHTANLKVDTDALAKNLKLMLSH